ncbi:hypothetical protein BVY04_01055 [bacterium M21]|nr:hypothetical protein BVY04_01055 [bacterium M21]
MKILKRFLMTGLRAVIGFGLAFYFLHRLFDKKAFVAEISEGSFSFLFLAVAGYGFALLLSFYRWQKLLDVQGIHIGYGTITRLGMIGTFFNSCLPGAVSGDVAKMVYIRHHAPGKRAEAILTILLDRLLGLFALLIVATIACILNMSYLLSAEWRIQAWTIGVGAASTGGICAILTIVFKNFFLKAPGILPLVALGRRALPDRICGIIERVVNALDLYRNNRVAVAYAMGISMINHIIMAAILLFVARAIHEVNVPTSKYLLTSSVSNAVSSIPISPGGFGIRDSITNTFLTQAGAAAGKAAVAPILVTLVLAFWSLVGGLFYVIGRVGAGQEKSMGAFDSENTSLSENTQ